MKIKKIAALALFFIIVSTSHIVELNNQTLNDYVLNNDYIMLYIYSPTCKNCLVTNIQFSKLVNNMNQSNVKFANISGDTYKDVAKKFGVQSYPRLFFFDQTFVLPYKGPSDAKGMQQWIKNYLSQRVYDANLQDLKTVRKPYIVLSGQGANQRRILNKALYGIERVKAFHVKSSYKVKLTLHTKKSTVQYKDDFQRIKLNEWIQNKTISPLISLNDKQNNQFVIFSKKPALIVFLQEEDEKNYEKFDLIENICQKYIQKIGCGLILKRYQSYDGLHKFFKLKDNSTFIGFVKQKMNIAYYMNMDYNKINQKSLINFIEEALADKIERVVDNSLPSSIKFKNVKQLNLKSLDEALNKNKYVFVNFYKSNNDNTSLFFSRPYEALASIVKSQDELKEVIIAAFDCSKFQKQCNQKKFMFYPTLQLFVNGIPVEFQKTPKLPQIPDLTKFLAKKLSKKVKTLQSQNIEDLQKPFVLITSSKIEGVFQALPALYDTISFYHKKSKQNSDKIQFYALQNPKIYSGKINYVDLIDWIKEQTQFLLADLLKEVPDQRIAKSVKNKKPIMFLLDSNQEKSKKYKIDLGFICKKLKIVCAYADSKHSAYSGLLQWIFLEPAQQSRLIYADVSTDKKYLYPGSLDEINFKKIQQFTKDVVAGKISALSQQNLDQEIQEASKEAKKQPSASQQL